MLVAVWLVVVCKVCLTALFCALSWLAVVSLAAAVRYTRQLRQFAGRIQCPKHGLLGPVGMEPRILYQQIKDLSTQLGSVYWFRLLHTPVVAITDPDLAAHILGRLTPVDKPLRLYRTLKQLMSAHGYDDLLTSPTNSQWKAARKAVAPWFSSAVIRTAAIPCILHSFTELVRHLEKGPRPRNWDLQPLVMSCMIDMFANFGFMYKLNHAEALNNPSIDVPYPELRHHMAVCAQVTGDRILDPAHTLKFWRTDLHNHSFKYIHAFFHDLYTEVKQRVEQHPGRPARCLGESLVGVQDAATGRWLADGLLEAHVAVLFEAGFDTSSHTVLWAIHMVSEHPHVEQRLLEELKQHGLLASTDNPNPRDPTYDDISNLPYLDAVVKESMRLYPVASLGMTRVVSPGAVVTVRGARIYPGTLLSCQLYGMFRSKECFSRPDECIPERWLPGHDGRNIRVHNPKAFMPFSMLTYDGSGGWTMRMPKGVAQLWPNVLVRSMAIVLDSVMCCIITATQNLWPCGRSVLQGGAVWQPADGLPLKVLPLLQGSRNCIAKLHSVRT